jgi:hypothetical protein
MEDEGIHLTQPGGRKTSSIGVSLVQEKFGFLSIVTIGSRPDTKCLLCNPDLMMGDYCIIGNRSTGESNHSRTVDDRSHLQSTVNPLPVDKIPETLLQIQRTTRTVQYMLPDLSTLLSFCNQFW